MFLVQFSNEPLLYHETEQINCEDIKMLCKVMYFYTFSVDTGQKNKTKHFFKCSNFMLSRTLWKYTIPTQENILISPNGKGLRLDISQVNSLKTHYLIQDWSHLHV